MAIRSKEFVGIAEGIRSHELSTKQTIEGLKGKLVNLSGTKQSLEGKISYLDAAIAAAYEDTDEDGEPDYGLIASLEAEKSEAESDLSDVEGEIDNTGSELEQSESELEAVLEEKEQTLFEIQERARQTSQNISLAGGMYGAYSGVGNTLQGSLQSSLSALSQAAGILGGSVQGASGGTSGNSASGSGNTASNSNSTPSQSGDSSGSMAAFTANASNGTGLSPASQFATGQGAHTPASVPSFGHGAKSINTKPLQNFNSEQGTNGYAATSFSPATQESAALPSGMQYTSGQKSQNTSQSFSSGNPTSVPSSGSKPNRADVVSADELAYLDANTADTRMLHMARDSSGKSIPAQQAAYNSPFSNQQDTGGTFAPDGWKPTQISQGTVLYQLGEKGGTKSSYFTDQDTVQSCINPKTGKVYISLLKEKLQITDPSNQKDTLVAYLVTDSGGVFAAEGHAKENPQYGSGGGRQYFVINANAMKGSGGVLQQIDISDALDVQKHPSTERQHSKREGEFFDRIAATPREHTEIIHSSSQKELQEYVRRNNLATFADFGSLNQKVSRDLVQAIYSAKKEFPFLQMSYVGSLQSRNQFAQEKLRQHYTEAYQKANPTVSLDALRPHIEKRVQKDMEDFSFESDDIAISYYFDKEESFADGARKLAIGIAVNEDLASNYENTQAMCERMVRKGASPQGCTTIKSVIDHEIAHQISDKIGAHNDPDIQSLFDKFSRQSEERCADLLSTYAKTDIHEFIAEAWAEYSNNPNPRRIALFVGAKLKELGSKYSSDDEKLQERVL